VILFVIIVIEISNIIPLSANVKYTLHDADVACNGCLAQVKSSREENLLKNGILNSVFRLSVEKLEFTLTKIPTFLKGALHLTFL